MAVWQAAAVILYFFPAVILLPELLCYHTAVKIPAIIIGDMIFESSITHGIKVDLISCI